ncbi:MAG: hypothetical protein ACRBC3_10655 [Burkholderiaceae bacterium]
MAVDGLNQTPGEQEQEPWKQAVVFVFSQMPELSGPHGMLPPIAARLSERLSADQALVAPLLVYDVVEQDGQIHASVQYDQHQFRMIGQHGVAQDDSLGRAIECSHWSAADKQLLAEHKAHLVCYYLGEHEDPAERIIAIHRLAAALVPEGLTGVIDPEAWNCLPAATLLEITKATTLNGFRSSIPAGLWTGFVKMFVTEQDLWFCSKGMHRWGLPDFALSGTNEESLQISELFFALTNYAIASESVLKAGDVVELGPDLKLAFDPVTAFAEYLNGPSGTLVVRRLTA